MSILIAPAWRNFIHRVELVGTDFDNYRSAFFQVFWYLARHSAIKAQPIVPTGQGEARLVTADFGRENSYLIFLNIGRI